MPVSWMVTARPASMAERVNLEAFRPVVAAVAALGGAVAVVLTLETPDGLRVEIEARRVPAPDDHDHRGAVGDG